MLKLRARDGATLVVENFIVFRFVQAYLIVSAIALLTTIEFAASIEAEHNTDGIYCDYNVAGPFDGGAYVPRLHDQGGPVTGPELEHPRRATDGART